ncbi:MFS transporter [Amycolatopsis sp. lyj-90]|uniref:MFS transporter n=1 Tax=Amycolatopsis sp. lyj-90 TaxID=2789285 RepID=UPI00397CD5A9
MGPKAGRREWVGLALLALPLFVLAMDVSVLFLAAPHIGADLAPGPTQWLWAMDVYGFMIAGFLVTMGAIGDRIGRRRLLLIGSVAFAAASVAAALARSPEMFVGARAVLGLAGATLMPSTLALIRTMFRDDRQRTTAIAVWMTTFSVGVALGPLLGGVLLQMFWWGSVFLVAVPVMALVVLSGRALLPESRATDPDKVDVLSVVLSVTTMIALVYALKEFVAAGPDAVTVSVLILGTVTGTVFARRQRAIPNPLVAPGLFAARVFRVALTLLTIGIFTITAVNFLVPQFLQTAAGLSPLRAGLLTAPMALSAIGGSLAAPALASRLGLATVIGTGAVVSLAGYLVLAQSGPDDPLWTVVVGGALAVFGLSPATVLTTDLVVGAAPEEHAGSAAALSETCGELAVALGIAVMGTLATVVYRLRLDGLLPPGIAPETRDAVRESHAAADRVAAGLPPDSGQAVLGAAREAFGTAFSAVGYVCAAVTVGLGALAILRLRRRVTA